MVVLDLHLAHPSMRRAHFDDGREREAVHEGSIGRGKVLRHHGKRIAEPPMEPMELPHNRRAIQEELD